MARVALDLSDALESFYPVEGRPWSMAGQPQLPTTRPVLRALARLRECWWEPIPGGGLRKIEWAEAPVSDLVSVLRRLLRHYGWFLQPIGPSDGLAPGECRAVPWTWPHLPPISPVLLEEVRKAARRVLSAAQGVEAARMQENETDHAEQIPEGQRADQPVDLPTGSASLAEVIAEAREDQSVLEQLERLSERAEARRARVAAALAHFGTLIPGAAGCDVDHPVPVDQGGPLAEALLDVCQVAREEGFARGIEEILKSDRANGNVLLAVCLYERGWMGDRAGILELLEQLDGLPTRPHAFDPNATCQLRVWEAVRSMFGHILPWYPAGRTIPSWHPDMIEANSLMAKLFARDARFSVSAIDSTAEGVALLEQPATRVPAFGNLPTEAKPDLSGSGGEDQPPSASPEPSEPSTAALDPDIQAILDKAREQEARAAQLQREQEAAQAHRRRAHQAWLRVGEFRGDAIPKDLQGDARIDR
jgi:hypothetical protein